MYSRKLLCHCSPSSPKAILCSREGPRWPSWPKPGASLANVLSSLPNLALYPVGALLRKSRDRGIHVVRRRRPVRRPPSGPLSIITLPSERVLTIIPPSETITPWCRRMIQLSTITSGSLRYPDGPGRPSTHKSQRAGHNPGWSGVRTQAPFLSSSLYNEPQITPG